MFNAQFISCSNGVSSKSGNDWYKIEFIAETVNNGHKFVSCFCTSNAFHNCSGLQYMSDIKVACGVTDNGYLTVNAVKGV